MLLHCPVGTNRSRRAASRGFTLTEMLVTLATLAVIIGLVLSSLGQARAQSQSVVCTNNLRQLHGAIQMYATDNDDRVPPYQNVLGTSWGQKEGGPEQPIPERGAELISSLSKYTKSKAIWFCPMDRFAGTDSTVGNLHHKHTSYRTGMSMNYPMPGTPVAMTGIAPHLQVLLTDNLWGCDYQTQGSEPSPLSMDAARAYSHNDRHLYLYFDGHVKSHSRVAPDCVQP